jgi:hypothetical protein
MTRLLMFTGPNVAIEPSATEICAPLPAAMPPTGTAITGFDPQCRDSAPLKSGCFNDDLLRVSAGQISTLVGGGMAPTANEIVG